MDFASLEIPPDTPSKATLKQGEVAKETQQQRPTEELDVSRLKNLATVEVVDLTSGVNRPIGKTEYREGDDRWKTEWNGRPNYKGFRRSARKVHKGSPQVCISLVE